MSNETQRTQRISVECLIDRARMVIKLANQEAQRFNREYVGSEHVVLGRFKEGNGMAANVLKNLGLKLEELYNDVLVLLEWSVGA